MKFGFLAKFLPPPENKFYHSFEEAVEVCVLSAQLFYQIVNSDVALRQEYLTQAKKYKKRGKESLQNSLTLLNATFITPIDREDIQQIASYLYRCTKVVLKACVNLQTYKIDSYSDVLKKQAEYLMAATDELKNLIFMMKSSPASSDITARDLTIKDIESTGDDLLSTAMEDLFSGKYDALYIIKMRNIYKGIENGLDACSDISDLVVSIEMKHG
ncbi:MAG: DUF47 family protein [Desulfobulbaceae bacterium]|jgi:uncharacterized protein Yka (UPF0111/DUF47 family)|nr:DUF47 family protein [Desulfobulbaceae bacterium]